MIAAIDEQDIIALKAHPGLYETVQHIPMIWAAFPDARHTIERQFSASDMVATCAIVRGTHQGPFLGVAPTGKPVEFMVLMIDQVADGKIVLHYAIPDLFSLLAIVGMLPTPGPVPAHA
jgi:predicted ester cyclase